MRKIFFFFRNFPDELVLPFLWAQDGFSEPSEEMAEAIKFGLSAPKKISFIGKFSLQATWINAFAFKGYRKIGLCTLVQSYLYIFVL